MATVKEKKETIFYDFIDLRWVGKGYYHMYCFRKIDDTNKQTLLDHKNMS
ncbi:hypothetical protein [Candidatus Phytoplasma luffae]|nr:hypothetical protein [Candidatus Phytoplasma luffae]